MQNFIKKVDISHFAVGEKEHQYKHRALFWDFFSLILLPKSALCIKKIFIIRFFQIAFILKFLSQG